MPVIGLSHPSGEVSGSIALDGSKSISNRALIIKALSGVDFELQSLSTSDDTRVLERLLSCDAQEYNVGHAGTSFRFLTAFLAIKAGSQILTGSARMLQRPIGPLVDALQAIGCNIEYLGVAGFPPLHIHAPSTHFKNEVWIDAGISSQYITALMLIAPTLPRGLKIGLNGDLVSESYLKMTIATMEDFGIKIGYSNQIIDIAPQSYHISNYRIEADWSAASYYYSVLALAKRGSIRLSGLYRDSTQGDAAMIDIGRRIGIETNWVGGDVVLSKVAPQSMLQYDFINQPDIAQTVAVICGALGIQTDFSGLKTLRIKETDRILALDQELKKVGSGFELIPSVSRSKEHYRISGKMVKIKKTPRFETYKDHRMAMALAPLALMFPIEIIDPGVVAKSYPDFWKDISSLGFTISEVNP